MVNDLLGDARAGQMACDSTAFILLLQKPKLTSIIYISDLVFSIHDCCSKYSSPFTTHDLMRKPLDVDNNRYEKRVNATYNKTKWTTYTAGRGLGMGFALANHRNLE